MKYKIKATNKKNSEVVEYELERNEKGDIVYYDETLAEKVGLQEVTDNVIREVNNNLMIVNSPINTLKTGEKAVQETSMTFKIEIEAI